MVRSLAIAPSAAVLLAFIAIACLALPAVATTEHECGDENANCHPLAYCENITVGGVYTPTCVCPEGTIGELDFRDNDPPFTSGICNKDLWTVRYIKEATAWGEWRTCAGGLSDGGANHGREHCEECKGQLRYGRDDPTVNNYPGPWWTISEKELPETAADFECSASWFEVDTTDPYPNDFKACDCRELVELPSEKWTKCAEEWGECTCDGTVLFGSDGFKRGYVVYETNGEEVVSCTNNNLGDPDQGQYKACYCIKDVKRTFMSEYGPGGSVISSDTGYGMCEAGAGGYYFRKIGETLEVNCLYDNETLAEEEAPDYADSLYLVEPRVYRWVLPTTAEPLEIPPTGMEVQSVYFNTTCADSGCWVIKGVVATGEAFNDFSTFNTFFLPQAVGDDQASSDFDYTASGSNVDWTFQPANHPCSSVGYEAGADTFRVSYCCIDDPSVGPDGGFVANYRPTKNFVNWGTGFERCDAKITDADGNTKCWRAMGANKDTWIMADARCRLAGGVLPSLANEAENQQLKDLAASKFPDSSLTWLGLWDRNSEASWEWSDGTDAAGVYSNWKGTNPNDSGPAPFGEDCGALRKSDGRWIDEECARHQYNYFCQFDNDDVCAKNVIQRPKYSAPNISSGGVPCWEVEPVQVKTWDDAQAACIEKGGYLAHVDDPEKFHLMKRMLDETGVHDAWIGLTDAAAEETFAWVNSTSSFDNSEPYPFMGWKFRQPNSWRGNGDNEDCVKVIEAGKWWVDDRCSKTNRYVCEVPRVEGEECDSDLPNLDPLWNIPFPVDYDAFMFGQFKGMDVSPGVVEFNNLDPYFGQFEFTVMLDEVELRQLAGQLRGTVGVEHTVDTFLGLTNFKPTGLANGVLDTFSTQVAIHLEKTSFFSISTHGTNQYTFLEYVNMRLVSVYNEDADFSSDAESAARTVRTSSKDNANYVQVTFTLGTQYTVNNNPISDIFTSGLVPLDSVRAGRGVFLDAVEDGGGMEHVCSEYERDDGADGMVGLSVGRVAKATFDTQIAQDCGPKSTMCKSPNSIPDNFVSFNIPLGKEIFEDPADDLSNNIFVSMVVSALDSTGAGTSGGDDEPDQMKTTLTASIPIVTGGINIFCDGFTAKTDLKDVANADIIVGTAAGVAELSRLRIVENVANTDLARDLTDNVVDSASIESGLLTLVLKGQPSYFAPTGNDGANTLSYSLELDDVITIHMMEDGSATTSTKEAAVTALLNENSEDNSDTNGLLTGGYKLNDAFYFTVERGASGNPGNTIARLEPTPELLGHCPFNPPRPSSTSVPLETCITRRDVQQRTYPVRTGAEFPTAMEIFNSNIMEGSSTATVDSWTLAAEEAWISGQNVDAGVPCPGAGGPATGKIVEWANEGYGCEAGFMTSVLGDSREARSLGKEFVGAIRSRYALNGRYIRAYWINPGYEWTPTQTAGASRFRISQKVFLFALITLDENWSRRRMLLQADPTQESGSGLAASKYQFSASTKSLMAGVYDTTQDRVALFEVELQLTKKEACMSPVDLQSAIQATFQDYLSSTASSFRTVQVTSLERELNGEECGRRRSPVRSLLSFSAATAKATMLVVFSEGSVSKFNPAAFATQPGITGISADEANSERMLDLDETYKCVDNCGVKEDGSGGSDNTALIAGVVGGVCGALLIAAGVIFYMRKQGGEVVTAQAVQTISVSDLKAQLADESA